MTRAKRFHSLLRHAGREESDAARQLSCASREVSDTESRLAMLTGFRTDYSERAGEQVHTSRNAHTLKVEHQFFLRLDEGIRGTESQLENAKIQLAARELVWRGKRKRTLALEKAIEKETTELCRRHNRREQRQLDAYARRGNGDD